MRFRPWPKVTVNGRDPALCLGGLALELANHHTKIRHLSSPQSFEYSSKDLPELWERVWMRTLGVETRTQDFPGVEPHASLGREGRGWLILTNPTLLWPQMSSRREALWFRVSVDACWAGATGPGVSAVFLL